MSSYYYESKNLMSMKGQKDHSPLSLWLLMNLERDETDSTII